MAREVKESLLFSGINILGIVFSIFASLYVYPLSFEIYGFLQFLLSVSNLLVPVLSLSVSSVIINYYSEYTDHDRLNELISLSLVSTTILIGVFILLAGFLRLECISNTLDYLSINPVLVSENLGVITGITYCLVLMSISSSILVNYKKITVPQVLNNVLLKIIIAILVYLVFIGIISQAVSARLLLVYFIMATILLWIYQSRYFSFTPQKISRFTQSRLNSIMEYSFFSCLSGMGSSLVYRLDIIMITLILGVKEAGYYSFFLFLANVIEIPGKAYVRIVSPQISMEIKKNRIGVVEEIYKKSSLNLMIIGGSIALGIYAMLETVLTFMKNGEELITLLSVWGVLVIAKWIDMTTSVNSQILAYSKYYKVNLLFLVVLGIVNLVLNYYLIHTFEILGAALATAISLILYNLIKYIFIRQVYRISPFTYRNIKSFLVLISVAVFIYSMPNFNGFPLSNIVVRGGGTGIILLLCLYTYNLSEDIENYISIFVRKAKMIVQNQM